MLVLSDVTIAPVAFALQVDVVLARHQREKLGRVRQDC